MPFTARALATPLSYAAPQIYEGSPDDEVLESLAFADLTGVLRQLGLLAKFSSEIFQGLFDDAAALDASMEDAAERLRAVQQQVITQSAAGGDVMMIPSPNTYDMDDERGRISHEEDEDTARMQFFTPDRRDATLTKIYEQCMPMPALHKLDSTVPVAKGSGNVLSRAAATCSSRYSNPNFFFEKWLEAEEKRQLAEKQRRDEMRARRKAQHAAREKLVSLSYGAESVGSTRKKKSGGKRLSFRRGSSVKQLVSRRTTSDTNKMTTGSRVAPLYPLPAQQARIHTVKTHEISAASPMHSHRRQHRSSLLLRRIRNVYQSHPVYDLRFRKHLSV